MFEFAIDTLCIDKSINVDILLINRDFKMTNICPNKKNTRDCLYLSEDHESFLVKTNQKTRYRFSFWDITGKMVDVFVIFVKVYVYMTHQLSSCHK